MSRTRNQRRRDRNIDRICCWILAIMLLFLVGLVIQQFREIDAMQHERLARESVTVVRAEDFLPPGFDPSCPGYQAALQRYDVEHGLILPEEKETAPEAATSEADRCKGAS